MRPEIKLYKALRNIQAKVRRPDAASSEGLCPLNCAGHQSFEQAVLKP